MFHTFASAEFRNSKITLNSYVAQFDHLLKLYEKNKKTDAKDYFKCNKWCKRVATTIKDNTNAWEIISKQFTNIQITQVYKWLKNCGVENLGTLPKEVVEKRDEMTQKKEKQRKKLGYNKENPWSKHKERKRKVVEDKYINKHGEAPSEEFWKRYWLGYNEKNPWSKEKERKRKLVEDDYRLTYGNAPPYEFWKRYWEKLIRKREREKRESERKKLSERMKLGYNKETPRSLDFEYNRALFEDEYRLTYGNAPPSNFDWQKWWKQKKKKIMEKMEKR
jgi:hypothetical protein